MDREAVKKVLARAIAVGLNVEVMLGLGFSVDQILYLIKSLENKGGY